MKKIIYTLFLITIIQFATAQFANVDSIRHAIDIANSDTIKCILYGRALNVYTESNADSAYFYAEKMLSYAHKANLKLEEQHATSEMGYAQLNMGNYPRSLQLLLSAITLAADPKSEQHALPGNYPSIDEFTNRLAPARIQQLYNLARAHQYAGILYGNTNNYEKALWYHQQAEIFAKATGNLKVLVTINLTSGRVYYALKKFDSALTREQEAYRVAMHTGYKRYLGSILLNLGRIYAVKGNRQLANEYFTRAITASAEQKYFRGVAASNLALADLFKGSRRPDSVLSYIEKALLVSQYLDAPDLLLRSYTALANYYKSIRNNDSTVKYQALIININDSLFSSKQSQQFQNIDFDEQQRQQQIDAARATYKTTLRIYLLLAGLAIFLLVAILLWKNSRQRQRANLILTKQKTELEHTVQTLKSMQAQLIHSEKMASLGELTAGIAHEIQNPLNFINNFSEVNRELLLEMKEQIDRGDINEIKVIANNVIDNHEKINEHGKRADAIVKGMLQHSHTGSLHKEFTDINALIKESLRLSYHGYKSKDRNTEVSVRTSFDESIDKLNIIPADIRRVFLNLFNNAFYAIYEKKKIADGDYEPIIWVSTKKNNDKPDSKRVEIRIKDNGVGIPHLIADKIFQPFFTTKPAGQGTGLGLSLSYDAVKAHGGEIKVEAKEGEGAEFIIELPIHTF